MTDTSDPAAAEQAAHTALLAHRASCPARAAQTRCEVCADLTAAWQRALNRGPAGGQIPTDPAVR